MACNINLPLGTADCSANYGDLKAIGISDVRNTYSTYAAVQSIESVRAAIEENASYVVTPLITGVDVTASEAVTETDGFGVNHDTRNIPGGMILYFDSNPCDWNVFVNSLTRGAYYVELFLSGGGKPWKYLQKNANGYQNIKAKLNAMPAGLGLDNKLQQYRLKLEFQNIEELNNATIVDLIDPISDYYEAMPIGWSWEFSGSYTTTSQSILVWNRCDKSTLMTQTPTWRLIESNVDTPAVSAAAPASGVSELTITKNSTPVALVAGEYIKFVLESKTGDVIDYTTDVITFKV